METLTNQNDYICRSSRGVSAGRAITGTNPTVCTRLSRVYEKKAAVPGLSRLTRYIALLCTYATFPRLHKAVLKEKRAYFYLDLAFRCIP